MAYIGSGVEYGLHCLLWLVGSPTEPASSRDLAELQGISPSFLAKIFSKLEKAGIVKASEGIRGGYVLGRPATEISVLDVVDAIEGHKPLFDCQEIRGKCAIFGYRPPSWAVDGVCGVHKVMMRAEQSMRSELGKTSMADVATSVNRKAPSEFGDEVRAWLASRVELRTEARRAGVEQAKLARNRSR